MGYNTLMNILRKFALFVSFSLLPTALLSFGLLFAVHQVLGNPAHVKGALDKSGVYDAALTTLVKQATDKAGTRGGEATDSGQQAVQTAINEAVPPAYLKEQTNKLLDGVYAWLQGDSQQIQFNLDLTPVKTKLVDSLSSQARARAQTLPTCNAAVAMDLQDIDPFSAECLPPGVTPDAVANEARRQVLDSDMFKNSSITPQTIAKDNGKPLEEQLKPVSNIYKLAWRSAIIAGVAAVVFTVAGILLSRPRLGGIKRASIAYLSVGVTTVVLGLASSFLTSKLADALNKDNNVALQAKLAEAVRLLTNDLRTWWVGFGALLIVLAIAGLVFYRFKKESASPQPENTPKDILDSPTEASGPEKKEQ